MSESEEMLEALCRIRAAACIADMAADLYDGEDVKEINKVIRQLRKTSAKMTEHYNTVMHNIMSEMDPKERAEKEKVIEEYIKLSQSILYIWLSKNMVAQISKGHYPEKIEENVAWSKKALSDLNKRLSKESFDFYLENIMGKPEEENPSEDEQ